MEPIPGRTYRVIHKTPRQKYPRQFVLHLLEDMGNFYYFDARPLAGTQKLFKENIISMEEVPPGTRPMVNRVMKAPR